MAPFFFLGGVMAIATFLHSVRHGMDLRLVVCNLWNVDILI